MRLQWGANIDGDNIVEKQVVYLKCLTSANPLVSRIRWLHDGYRVEPSKRPGADTVVIQDVTPAHSGAYYCVTFNTEGDAVSRGLELRFKFRPRCEARKMKRLCYKVDRKIYGGGGGIESTC